MIANCFPPIVGATDAKGELIHQPLMKKKMERLDASTDFRPFKFRIQAFTNAFSELVSNTEVSCYTLGHPDFALSAPTERNSGGNLAC